MNLIQTALLALPAAVTGFLGALGFLSDPGAELKIAAIAGQTEFPAFTDKEILANWRTEMDNREAQNDKASQRQQKEETQRKNLANADLAGLTDSLVSLKDDFKWQNHVNHLGDWERQVRDLLKPIDALEHDDITLRLNKLTADVESLKQPDAKPTKEGISKLKESAREIDASIKAKREHLDSVKNSRDKLTQFQTTWKAETSQK